jgi:hypothetical protein
MKIVQKVKKIPNVTSSEILHSLKVAGVKGHPQTMCNRLSDANLSSVSRTGKLNCSSLEAYQKEIIILGEGTKDR